ncbi:MAG: hypothetical protein LAT55_10605 [Opitutales bacterium]|nr:hypothetical protein [Opitutales bacterium]
MMNERKTAAWATILLLYGPTFAILLFFYWLPGLLLFLLSAILASAIALSLPKRAVSLALILYGCSAVFTGAHWFLSKQTLFIHNKASQDIINVSAGADSFYQINLDVLEEDYHFGFRFHQLGYNRRYIVKATTEDGRTFQIWGKAEKIEGFNRYVGLITDELIEEYLLPGP